LDLIGRGGSLARYAAIEAIGSLDAEGLSPASLVTMIETAGPDLRPALIKALVAVTEKKDPTIWATLERGRWVQLLSALLDQEETATQLAAMTGLGFLGDRRGTGPILDCYRKLAEPTEDLADCAVGALVGTGDCTELIAAIQAEDDPAGPVALRALGELQSREAVPALTAVRRTSRDWERRRLALRALGMIGTAEAWDSIQEAIDDPTGYVRCEAASLLGTSDQETVVMSLLDRLTMERYQEVRDEIVETLARVGGRQVMQALVGLLSHGRREVRASAATAIGLARPQEGLGALIDALNDAEWQVRQAVIEALGHYDDPHALEQLLLALSDDHEKVRLAATVGVSRWDQSAARQALMTYCLADVDIWVRYRAAERLGHWKVADAVPQLSALASRRREPALLRRAAITALGQIGGEQAQAALSELQAQEEPDLREAVERALARGLPETGEGAQPWK
jgi:HEAT repeat protein